MSEGQRSTSADVVVIAAAVSAIGLIAAALPLRSWDYWYHLTLGRLVTMRTAVPSTNLFGYSMDPTEPVFVHTWLGEMAVYWMHSQAGLVGSLAVRNLSVMFAFALVAWATYQLSSRNAVVTAGLTGFAGVSFLAISGFAGPQMLAWPLFAGLLALSVAMLARKRGLFVLPIAFAATTALWVNLAPNFWIPTLLAGSFYAVARWTSKPQTARWFAASSALTVAAWFVTPHGFGIVEGFLNWDGMEAWMLLAGPAALGPGVAAFVSGKLPTIPRWVAALVTTLLIAATIAVQPWSDMHRAIPTAFFGDSVRGADPLRGYGPAGIPVEAVEVMRSWGSQPRVYAEPHLSGYLLFELQDPMAPLPIVWPLPERGPTDEVAALERALITEPTVFRGIFQQYGVSAVLVTEGLAPLGEWLNAAPDWVEVGVWPSGTLYIPRPVRAGGSEPPSK